MPRPSLSFDALLAPLSNESGTSLKYTDVYDKIKEARREDDDFLSQGIWQTELKKADWASVESLCVNALSHKTKDLQIIHWLWEAWVMLDGITGLKEGLSLLQKVCEKFWETLYPQNNDEYRLSILEWGVKTLSDRLLLLPFLVDAHTEEKLTLADWKKASSEEKIALQQNKKAPGLLKELNKKISRIHEKKKQDLRQDLEACLKTF